MFSFHVFIIIDKNKKDASKFCELNEHRSSSFHFHSPNFRIPSDPTAEKERENYHFPFGRKHSEKNKFKLESHHPIDVCFIAFSERKGYTAVKSWARKA